MSVRILRFFLCRAVKCTREALSPRMCSVLAQVQQLQREGQELRSNVSGNIKSLMSDVIDSMKTMSHVYMRYSQEAELKATHNFQRAQEVSQNTIGDMETLVNNYELHITQLQTSLVEVESEWRDNRERLVSDHCEAVSELREELLTLQHQIEALRRQVTELSHHNKSLASQCLEHETEGLKLKDEWEQKSLLDMESLTRENAELKLKIKVNKEVYEENLEEQKSR